MTLVLPFCCAAAAGFELDADFEPDFERDAGFDRDAAFDVAAFDVDALDVEAFDRAVGLDFVLGAEPLDDPGLDRFRGLLEAGLLSAILIPLLGREHASHGKGYPLSSALTQA
ncbi:MAG TPA: hypothetical protein VEW67_06465 [Thermoleophilaceae bacterium]|nr:hypothetical protein [Thermoleophilaceae bacterium]